MLIFAIMKRFRAISISFIAVIAVIFGCNVFYLVNLYNSIRETVEKDVMSALADADLDELWLRAEHASAERKARMEAGMAEPERKAELSAGINKAGNTITTTVHPDGTVSSKEIPKQEEQSFNNLFTQNIGYQFHSVMDPYVDYDLALMDSVLRCRLNDRRIYPESVAAEIINFKGEVVKENPNHRQGSYDVFTYSFNPAEGLFYRIYMTPLTRHILSEMAGVIVTIFLMMAAFTAAFIYLFRTVSKLRTIEEMKDDFVGNMTHELKTSIAIAYSANDALLNYGTDCDAGKKEAYLRIANKQLKRLGELVENILAMSMERRKTMVLRPETIELRPFIEDIAAAQRMRDDKHIEITVAPGSEASVEADRTHLAHVLNNLVDNAIKYSGEDVKIVVRFDSRGISVADNGIGIPEKALPYIFNKFYRVPHGNRQDVRGYGIGLYYVKSILDKMGWSISVVSREGEGSVFNIIFGTDEK